MIYCFDLDGTICTNTNGVYEEASPHYDRISMINHLYDDNHRIIIDTARCATTKINWEELTKTQLETWGVKYHEVRLGHKLNADIFVDDKGIDDVSFFGDETIGTKLDNYIRNTIKTTLDKDRFPDYDDVYTDTFSELIDKLSIVHIRYWYLEDAMAAAKSDEELVKLRKKSESLFKEKRPMLVAGLDKLIIKMINGEIDYIPVNTKDYKGWEQKEN